MNNKKILVSYWTTVALVGLFGYLAGWNGMKQKIKKNLISSEIRREKDQIEIINLIFKKKD